MKPSVKGVAGINNASKQRGDDLVAVEGDCVHAKCRREYTNSNKIKMYLQNKQCDGSPKRPIKKRLRSDAIAYDPKSVCLFCCKGERITQRNGAKHIEKLLSVRTTGFQEKIVQCSHDRDDAWSRDVSARLEYMQDCIASDVVYHNICSVNFSVRGWW